MQTPGETLQHELTRRGWTQADLAWIIGRPVQVINEIVRGKKQITPRTAIELGAALGTSAAQWLLLERHYRLAMAITKRQVAQSGKLTPPANHS